MYAGMASTSYFELKVIRKIALENIVTRHQTIYPSGLTESLTTCLFPYRSPICLISFTK